MMHAVRLERVAKNFGSGSLSPLAQLRPRFDRPVLRDVSFSVPVGSVVGLLGPNGSGKTTILKLIATLTVPSAGRVEIHGMDAVRHAAAIRKLLGLGLADDRSFYYRLTARANLEFFGGLGGLCGKRLRERIVHCARLFDLDADLDRLYGTFSTGMRHRLALARALLSDGAILVLDEPTRAIDPTHATEIRSLIRDRLVGREGKTVVVASNSLDEVHELCDQVAVLEHGVVTGTRPAAAVLHEQRLLLASGQ